MSADGWGSSWSSTWNNSNDKCGTEWHFCSGMAGREFMAVGMHLDAPSLFKADVTHCLFRPCMGVPSAVGGDGTC